MAYSVVTPAASEPITLTEAKNFLRVDGSDDDALITALISAAREMCEQYTRRILVTTTIDEYFDGFPNYKNAVSKDIIYLSRGPVQSITSLKYVDEIGSEETVASSYYVSDTISELLDGLRQTESSIKSLPAMWWVLLLIVYQRH